MDQNEKAKLIQRLRKERDELDQTPTKMAFNDGLRQGTADAVGLSYRDFQWLASRRQQEEKGEKVGSAWQALPPSAWLECERPYSDDETTSDAWAKGWIAGVLEIWDEIEGKL